jgi:hypothetical protein
MVAPNATGSDAMGLPVGGPTGSSRGSPDSSLLVPESRCALPSGQARARPGRWMAPSPLDRSEAILARLLRLKQTYVTSARRDQQMIVKSADRSSM